MITGIRGGDTLKQPPMNGLLSDDIGAQGVGTPAGYFFILLPAGYPQTSLPPASRNHPQGQNLLVKSDNHFSE